MRMFVPLAASAAILLAPQTPPPQVDTAAVLASASRWTVRLEQSLSGLLFRERLLQKSDSGTAGDYMFEASPRKEVVLEANVFLVRPPGARRFAVYRDVYRVGTRAVTDHTERLQALLTENTAGALAQARRLTDASAHFNLGRVMRNTNIPTMAFEYLAPEHVAGIRVRPAGRDTIDGRDLVVLEFQEIARPTIVRGPKDADVPAAGRYWIDPASGAVPRADVDFTVGHFTGKLDVRLELHPELKVWVPVQMVEWWVAGNARSSGHAEYDRFQRLAVSTQEIVK